MQRGDYLCTIDIKHAYKTVCVYTHQEDRSRQRLIGQTEINGEYFYFLSKGLCVGLSFSLYIFS